MDDHQHKLQFPFYLILNDIKCINRRISRLKTLATSNGVRQNLADIGGDPFSP